MCPISTRTFALRRSAEAVALIFLATGALGETPRAGADVVALTTGIFCAPPEGGRTPAPGTISGWVHIPEFRIEFLLRDTTRIPATLGLGFGVEFNLADSATRQLTYVISHPPMPPGGETRQTWSTTVPGGQRGAIFYQFDVTEELLPGTWTLSAHDGATELFHVPFTVLDPALLPQLADLCAGVDLFSAIPSRRAAAG